MLNLFPRPTLSQRLTMIVGALQKAAAARASKDWSIAPAVILLWGYLNRVTARFEALAARVRAGKLAPPRLRPKVECQPSPRRTRPPESFGWLLRRIPDAIHYRSQLQHLLTDPEMVALLAEVPQAGRLLRPLCRMLGLGPGVETPAALFPPKVSRRTRVPAAPPENPERIEDDPAPVGAYLATA